MRDAACPLSTRRGTRLVRLVRGRWGGGGLGGRAPCTVLNSTRISSSVTAPVGRKNVPVAGLLLVSTHSGESVRRVCGAWRVRSLPRGRDAARSVGTGRGQDLRVDAQEEVAVEAPRDRARGAGDLLGHAPLGAEHRGELRGGAVRVALAVHIADLSERFHDSVIHRHRPETWRTEGPRPGP